MSDQPPFPPPASPMAPPTLRYALPATPAVPVWPLVVGVICIVLGIGGIFFGLVGALSYTVLLPVMSRFQQGVVITPEMRLWTMVSSSVSMAVAVLLPIAGIGLAKRRRWSLPLARVWAVLRMVTAVVGVVLGVMLQSKQFAAMSAQGGMPPGMGRFTSIVGVFSMVFGLAWGWALPVFMLIWLGRVKIRRQTQEWV